MKKFLMYCVVLVSVLFISYTVYFFVRNNETISLTLAENEVIYMNIGDNYDLPIKWTKPYSSTKLTVTIVDGTIVDYVEETKSFYAKSGGVTSVEITTSNKDFGPFRFDIHVGDGRTEYPFVIRTEEELASIGNIEKFSLNASYILVSDLDLIGYENWSPIGGTLGFSGSFDGNYKSISNMKILGNKTNAGLFSTISQSSIIENVYMQNCAISGNFDNAGIIVGTSTAGTIRRCKILSSIIENSKTNSNNGGVVGIVKNSTTENVFSSFGYIELNSVEISAKTAGNFGGIAGYMQGSILINNKAYVKSFESTQNSLYVGLIAGVMRYANSSNYMFSIIKKCMAIADVLTINSSTTKVGAILGKDIDDISSGYSNKVKSCYYYCPNDEIQKVAESNNAIDVSTIYSRGIADLKIKDTFVGWNFDSIWTTNDDNKINEINFDDAQSEAFNELIPGDNIEDGNELWNIFEEMRKNPTAGTVYNIKKTDANQGVITLDLKEHGTEEWQTIAPSSTNPIRSSIVCDDDVEIIIKNGKIIGSNSSFFGYISGPTTKFNNITFENVVVNSTNGEIAVAFTGIQNGAMVDKVNVKDCNVEGSGEHQNTIIYIGALTASNNGIIRNCKVYSSDENYIKTSEKYVRIGGLVAKNGNQVENSIVDGYSIVLNYKGLESTSYLGGICGVLESGSLKECYFTNGRIENEEYNGTLYVGGVVANSWNATKVYRCLAIASLKTNTVTDSKKIGGVVAYSNYSEIIASYFNGSISGNFIAGVCAINQGVIDQCYADGELKGISVGGIAVNNDKTITNCYFRGNLIGLTTDSISCGICVTLPEGSSVANCFAKVSFTGGEGVKCAETKATFRAAWERWVGNLNLWGWWEEYKEPTGTFTNSIIVYSGDNVLVQQAIFGKKSGWIDCSDGEAQGTTGSYSKFKDVAKFDQSIWVFETGYPYLKNTPVLEN